MEMSLYRFGIELAKLHFHSVAGQYSWVMSEYNDDVMVDAEISVKHGVGGRRFNPGLKERPRRMVVVLDIQGTSHVNLHLAIRELETHLRHRDGNLQIWARRDVSHAFASIPVVVEQVSVDREEETFRARLTIRFVCLRNYWARDTGTTAVSTTGEFFRVLVFNLSSVTGALITGITEVVTDIDYRSQSNEWIIFANTRIWRAPFAGGAATVMETFSDAALIRGCVAVDGSIIACVNGSPHRVVRATYPSGHTVLGNLDGAPWRVRKVIDQDAYSVVGRFNTYGSSTGLAGIVLINTSGGVISTFSPFTTAQIGPTLGAVTDVFRTITGVGVATAYDDAISQSWLSIWSAGAGTYSLLESGTSTYSPLCLDQRSNIDNIIVTSWGNVHINRYMGTLATIRNLSSVVPSPYPTQRIFSIDGGVAGEEVSPSGIRKKIYVVRDGCPIPIMVCDQPVTAIRRVGDRVAIGTAWDDWLLYPLAISTSSLSNAGSLVETTPLFNSAGTGVLGCFTHLTPTIRAEVLDPQVVPEEYSLKYHTGAVLPGTTYDREMFFGLGNPGAYYIPTANPVSNLQVTWRQHFYDWR